MSFEAVVQQYFTNASAFFTKTFNRVTAARAALAAGTYNANTFATDSVGFWFDSMDAWTNAPPVYGAPLLPAVFITGPHNPANPLQSTPAFVPSTVVDGALSVTDLVGSFTIAATGNLTANVTTGQMTATLAPPASAKAGTYQSVAFRVNVPVGLIVVVLT